jgi:hypothetical protein
MTDAEQISQKALAHFRRDWEFRKRPTTTTSTINPISANRFTNEDYPNPLLEDIKAETLGFLGCVSNGSLRGPSETLAGRFFSAPCGVLGGTMFSLYLFGAFAQFCGVFGS